MVTQLDDGAPCLALSQTGPAGAGSQTPIGGLVLPCLPVTGGLFCGGGKVGLFECFGYCSECFKQIVDGVLSV